MQLVPTLKSRRILLGITGGIAAYKSAELVRLLRKHGAEVKVIMTKAAQEFITPLTMQTVSCNTVFTDMFQKDLRMDVEHIALARWADAVLVVPASANFMARLACGFADDLLTTVCLATESPIALAPAMNCAMWNAKITQANLARLRERGIAIFGPEAGEQACGEVGMGRMMEPEIILNLVPDLFASRLLDGKRVIITAGATREAIDPVRFISSPSSGKMGYAIAKVAADAGAVVTLISGPTNLNCPDRVELVEVMTAQNMHDEVMSRVAGCDFFIAAAAVADYRPVNPAKQKIKKNGPLLDLKLELNPDILAEVAALSPRPIIVGFAAETENLVKNAQLKLTKKKLDLIVANDVSGDLGFGSDDNEVVILQREADPITLSRANKAKLARELISIIAQIK